MPGYIDLKLLTDTHCHLNFYHYHHDLDQIIQRARDCDISRILVPGIDLATSVQAVELSEKYTEIFAAVGIHPNQAISSKEKDLNELQVLSQHPKVVAIGEIGLDYFRDTSPPDIQKQVLEKMLDLAVQVKKPVVIHNRQAWQDMWPILSNWQMMLTETNNSIAQRPGVLHSFDGNHILAKNASQQHFHLGVSGPITFTNALTYQTLVTDLPIEVILLETDSPYLTPHPHRGKRNEPANVKGIAEKIAHLHNRSYDDVLLETSQNADDLFLWRSID